MRSKDWYGTPMSSCDTANPLFGEDELASNILADIPVGIIIVSAKVEVVYVNEAACRCLRLTREQIRDKKPPHYKWHMINRDGSRLPIYYNRILMELLEGHEVRDKLVGVWNEESGLYNWLMLSAKPDMRRSETRYLVMLHDVTELIESKERYKTITEHSLDAICIIDGTQWVYLNQPGLDLFEADGPEQLIGMPYENLLHSRHHAGCRERCRSVLEDHRVAELIEEEWFTLKGNRLHCEVLGVPTVLGNKRMIKLIIRNITERKRAQEMLLQSEKLNIAGQIAASVAHEIRNPLTSLKGFIKLMRQQGATDRYLQIMEVELERINSIAQEMLYLGKPQTVDKKVLSLPAILEQVTGLMESQAHMMNVSIELLYAERLRIMGDENQLKQLLINLIKNAVEAMPDGGKIFVRSMREEGYAVLTVEDQGSGIPKEQIENLGRPFFTTKSGGTGLGLMVCRNIIKEHDGLLEVSSRPGCGTVFTVRLPLVCDNNNSPSPCV
ncbi:ATP-binding protein [Gorillibacterium sp. sgz5001074]|uniref:ATP-binding protein n=1 Tax=Gorillibacterium sp. sgz5001074 TaxID=3446695 RepID=UPI003F66E9DF